MSWVCLQVSNSQDITGWPISSPDYWVGEGNGRLSASFPHAIVYVYSDSDSIFDLVRKATGAMLGVPGCPLPPNQRDGDDVDLAGWKLHQKGILWETPQFFPIIDADIPQHRLNSATGLRVPGVVSNLAAWLDVVGWLIYPIQESTSILFVSKSHQPVDKFLELLKEQRIPYTQLQQTPEGSVSVVFVKHEQ